MNIKIPKSMRNWISLIGAMIALICFFMIVFLFFITMILGQGGSYIGLVIYVLLPAVMIMGLLLIPVGMYFNLRRLKKSGQMQEPTWPRIDLNNKPQRRFFFNFAIATTVFLFISAVGSYEAFHFTESVPFCGTICHAVMKPEYTAYQHSAHARVACVDCHVGEGADWYVRSKLAGLYQVYAVLTNIFPRPIPTPVKNLRPARETCERCHWPQKFYAQKFRAERHYLNDEQNTEWDIQLIMKIGAEYSALGLIEGIHWHINPQVKIEYLAADEKNLEIPWVRYTDLKNNRVITYNNEENPVDSSLIRIQDIRTMDCMDCHNRPSHSYKPPAFFVNEALTAGLIPKELPQIKSLSMQICSTEFNQTDSARQYIQKSITEFYQTNYAEVYQNKKDLIDQAIAGLQEAHAENIFPEMKVRWNAYPNHIGHLEFQGCLRCHNDKHKSSDGRVISKDCNLCHHIIAQGTPGQMSISTMDKPLEFRHPTDVDVAAWQEGSCTDCHTGLNP
jgi:nitrate/TMAO reductase-like tetraheme cytochrome c subunit